MTKVLVLPFEGSYFAGVMASFYMDHHYFRGGSGTFALVATDDRRLRCLRMTCWRGDPAPFVDFLEKHRSPLESTGPLSRPQDGVVRETSGLTVIFELLGLTDCTPETRWARKPAQTAVLSPFFPLALEAISRRADPEALAILRAAAGTWIETDTYRYYAEPGPTRERRLAFARAWPSFAALAVRPTRPTSPPAPDRFEDPSEAMADLIRAEATDLDEAAVRRCLVRLSGRTWPIESNSRMKPVFRMLARMPEDRIPTTSETEAFVGLSIFAEELIPTNVPDWEGITASIMASIPGRTWKERELRLLADGRRRFDALVPGETFWTEEKARRFLSGISALLARFAWRALLPALAMRNGAAAHVFEYGSNIGLDDRPLIPPRAFEASCAKLFLEGIDYERFVDLMDALYRLPDDEQPDQRHDRLPAWPIASLTSPHLAQKRFEPFRALMRPQHRDLTVDGALDISLREMAARGAVIATFRDSPSRTEAEFAGGERRFAWRRTAT